MSEMYCATPDYAIAAARAQWPRSCMATLRFYANFNGLRGLDNDGFTNAAKESLQKVSRVSGLNLQWTNTLSNAHIEMKGESMRGGILAYAYFPGNNCRTGLVQRFNNTVNWSYGLFLDTLSHELGHNFGLPHTQDRRDIMYPSMIQGRSLDGEYGPHYSIPEMVGRYGDPVPVPQPPGDEPEPEPPGDPIPQPELPTWLEIVFQLLSSCIGLGMSRQAIIESVRSPNLRQRIILERRTRLAMGISRRDWNKSIRDAVMQPIYMQGLAATDQEIEELVDEAESKTDVSYTGWERSHS